LVWHALGVFTTTNHQPPTTNHQPPTTNHQPPTTNHQPPTTNHQPPTTNHQLDLSISIANSTNICGFRMDNTNLCSNFLTVEGYSSYGLQVKAKNSVDPKKSVISAQFSVQS
jgi:hypothetical protein